MTLFIWWFLLPIVDRPICSLWISQPLTPAALVQACGAWPLANIEYMAWRGVSAADGYSILCPEQPASELPAVDCAARPGEYRIDIIWPDFNQVINHSVTVEHPGPPTDTEVLAQSPESYRQWKTGKLTLELVATSQPEAATPQCRLPTPDNHTSLATHAAYEFLAGRLTWYALPGTQEDWQNQWDDNIRGAADAASVPAELLKRIMAQESQFWPSWTGDRGEVGLIQLTDDGADTALRFSLPLFERYCPRAIYPGRCGSYDLLTGWERSHVRAVLLVDLTLTGHPLDAAQKVRTDLWTYAQVLAGTYCHVAAITGAAPAWETVAAVYHAGGSCLQPDGSLCAAGAQYLEQIQP
jgi:hypothetical protein